MSSETNPLAGIRDIDFTRHALFRMKERGMSEYEIFRGITAPSAAARIDDKSGHLIFHIGPFSVVARRDSGEHVTVITVIAREDA